jgi:hypothetical protein
VLRCQALLTNQHIVPLWAAYLQLLLPIYNAMYFAKQVTLRPRLTRSPTLTLSRS